MNSLDKLNKISKQLALFDIESAQKEAEVIMREVLNIDLVSLYRDNPQLTDEELQKIERIVARRCRREPLQYIFSYTEFLGMKIEVSRGVLIPRPETELLAEHAIRNCRSLSPDPQSLTILDLCTGSGCLALAVARAFPESIVCATDSSDVAIKQATINAKINNIKNVRFYQGDVYSALPATQRFHLIISNPPYIKTGEIKNLQPEIQNWEPVTALDGGSDGLFYYRRIISDSQGFINNYGMLILECGEDQAQDISDMMGLAGYSRIKVKRDFAGKERIIQGQWIK